jgi:plastocyanin
MKIKFGIIRLLILAALAWVLPSARSATYVVRIGDYWFNATNLTINVGDTVTWSNTSLTAHDTTQNTNLWASQQLAQGQTFSYNFTKAGRYPYICKVHIVSHPEQTGTVSVVSGPALPSVTITNPAANATFQAPASFAVGATATETGGTITNVQFTLNGSLLGNDATSPYGASVSGLGAGSYTLAAIASDGAGLKATNSINVTVANALVPPTVTITNPAANAIFSAPATFEIDATASDSDGTVTNLQFLVNGGVISNATTVPYSAMTSSLAAGGYVLTAVASDNSGLKATNSINVTVTNPLAPPTVTITNPLANATFQAPATFTIGASASDSNGSVTNVQFLVNGSPIGTDTAAPYSATASGLVAGAYVLTAVATDNSCLNATNSINVTVTNPLVPPTVTITNPLANATFQAPASFILAATASDSGGSVTNVQFLINGSVVGNATATPYTASASGLAAGAYILAAVASDNVGLKATNSISITVTNQPLAAVTISNPSFDGSSFRLSFATQTGYTYNSQFSASLSGSGSWVTFNTVAGNGTTVTVTNGLGANVVGYYRVLAH